MTQPAPTTQPPTDGAASGGRPRSLLSDVLGWLVPIALGAGMGLLVLYLWNAGKGPVHTLVMEWDAEDFEHNESLVEQIRELGPDARADLLEEFQAIDGEFPDWKLWTATLLGQEPFFDSASLKELAASGDKWDRRVAAAALVDVLPEEGLSGPNLELILPPLIEWLEDLSVIEHTIPLRAVERLTVTGELRTRLRNAVVKLADRNARKPTGDESDDAWLQEDRENAVSALAPFIPDEEVLGLLWAIAHDESDDQFVRVMALRVLAEAHVFDDPTQWEAPAQSANEIVRQTVADNLYRSKDPAMNAVLAPLCFDAHALVRSGAIDSQTKRRMPTFLKRFGEIVEDADVWVAARACLSAPYFTKNEGAGARAGMLLQIVGESDRPEVVEAAVVALTQITGDHAGFAPGEVKPRYEEVDSSALTAFMQDAGGRKAAVERWQDVFKGTAVWLAADRKAALEALLDHADPANVERAKTELAKLR